MSPIFDEKYFHITFPTMLANVANGARSK